MFLNIYARDLKHFVLFSCHTIDTCYNFAVYDHAYFKDSGLYKKINDSDKIFQTPLWFHFMYLFRQQDSYYFCHEIFRDISQFFFLEIFAL